MRQNRGFSLVELSMVLVIIAFIVGGALGGSNLVHNSKLLKVTTELRQMESAVKMFREKFKYYPGDYPNATTYWSGTGNGNGNWKVDDEGAQRMTEGLYAWQHLSKANLLPTAYTGVDAGTPDYAAGKNVPSSAINQSAFYVFMYYGTTIPIFSTKGNVLHLGSSSSNTDPWGNAVNATDAQAIDIKIDDGKPGTGTLYANKGNNGTVGTCASQIYSFAGDASTVTYVLTDTDLNCRLWYWLDKNK